MLMPAYLYMVAYFYNVQKNVDSAYFYNNKILEIDPANVNATKNKAAFEAYLKQTKGGSAKKEDHK